MKLFSAYINFLENGRRLSRRTASTAKSKLRGTSEILLKNLIRIDTPLDWAELNTELEVKLILKRI